MIVVPLTMIIKVICIADSPPVEELLVKLYNGIFQQKIVETGSVIISHFKPY